MLLNQKIISIFYIIFKTLITQVWLYAIPKFVISSFNKHTLKFMIITRICTCFIIIIIIMHIIVIIIIIIMKSILKGRMLIVIITKKNLFNKWTNYKSLLIKIGLSRTVKLCCFFNIKKYYAIQEHIYYYWTVLDKPILIGRKKWM